MLFFKNVKTIFWGDVVMCAMCITNRCPSHALENKTLYEMWFGRVPSIHHPRVFGSTCYALVPKEQRNKLGARNQKCIFLGYVDTNKGYRLHDEVNKKFLFARDVTFMECSKSDLTIEQLLDHLDRLTCGKHFFEIDYEIPNMEGGIPILDQSFESMPLVPILEVLDLAIAPVLVVQALPP